jgi:hypothetical protein
MDDRRSSSGIGNIDENRSSRRAVPGAATIFNLHALVAAGGPLAFTVI